jgi:hypothetical protein
MEVLIVDQDNVELNDKITNGEGNWHEVPKTKIREDVTGYYVTVAKKKIYIGADMFRPRLVQQTIPEGDLIESRERKLLRRLYQVYYV